MEQFGRISDVGVYAGFTNHFNIGAFMEKGQTMRGSQARPSPASTLQIPCAPCATGTCGAAVVCC